MKNRSWMMLICCLVPLLFIFVAPALGLNKNSVFPIFIVAIFLCFMMMGRGGGCCGGGHKHDDEEKGKKEGQHGCH